MSSCAYMILYNRLKLSTRFSSREHCLAGDEQSPASLQHHLQPLRVHPRPLNMSRSCDDLLTPAVSFPIRESRMSDIVNEKEWRKRHKIRRFRDKKGFIWSRLAPEVEISHHRPPEPHIVKIETETRPPPPHVIDSFDDDSDDSTLDVGEDKLETLEAGHDSSSLSVSSLGSVEGILVTDSEGVDILKEGGPSLDFLAASEPPADSDSSDIPQSDKSRENISAFKTNVRRNGGVRQAQARETLIE